MADFNPRQNANANDLSRHPGVSTGPPPPQWEPPVAAMGADPGAMSGSPIAEPTGVPADVSEFPPPASWDYNSPGYQQPSGGSHSELRGYPPNGYGSGGGYGGSPMGQQQQQQYDAWGQPQHPHQHQHQHPQDPVPQEEERRSSRKKKKKKRKEHRKSPSRARPSSSAPPPQSPPAQVAYEDEPIDDNVWNAIQQITINPPGATAEEFPAEKFQREVKRMVEVPYKQQVKVPVTASEDVVTIEKRKVPRKKVVEEQVMRTKRVPYTQTVPREKTRMKEIWVKQLVPETYTVQETQHLFRDVQVPEVIKREVECIEEVDVPVKKTIQVPSYRVDTVINRRIVEVSGVQEFDLVPREGAFRITAARRTECQDPLCPIREPHKEHPQERIVGRESYRKFGTNLDCLPDDTGEARDFPHARLHEKAPEILI